MDTTTTVDFRTNPEITEPKYARWLILNRLAPFTVARCNIEYRKLIRARYDRERLERAASASADDIAAAMIERAFADKVCTLCRCNPLAAPGEDMCMECIVLCEEAEAEAHAAYSVQDVAQAGRAMLSDRERLLSRAAAIHDSFRIGDPPRIVDEAGEGEIEFREAMTRGSMAGAQVNRESWLSLLAAWPFEHERTVNRVLGWFAGVLFALVVIAQVGMARGWWGR